MAPICEAVFVPVFWWCSEAVGRTRLFGLPRDFEAGARRPPTPTLPTPTCGAPTTLPLNILSSSQISIRPGRTYPRLSRSGRCTPGEDRLRRCFLHAASYNVIITASIPGEGGEHLESELEWGEQWVVPPELNIN